jgi:uncharacterized metal-binding protein YceD (DUF177 family)
MGHRRDFEIPYVGLKPGIHEFDYEITDRFFERFQQQDFRQCKANVKLTLDKKTGFMLLRFEIGGSLEVTCDRCNSNLPFELWDEFKLTVKMVENPELMNDQEEDPDVYYISRGESHIDVANWIYEFINLSIPMQRMCKIDEIGGPHCNKEVLEMLKRMDQDSQSENNSIWKGLEKFKDLDS